MSSSPASISGVSAAVYTFPTPEPEADGTLHWEATTAVTVTLTAGGQSGLGWTYSSPAAAAVVGDKLAAAVRDRDAHDIAGGWSAMHRACRNLGTKGLVMQAISAVDMAWWDLKARLLDVPISTLLGQCRSEVPIYGSGGFTTLTDAQLEEQVAWWQSVGCTAMKTASESRPQSKSGAADDPAAISVGVAPHPGRVSPSGPSSLKGGHGVTRRIPAAGRDERKHRDRVAHGWL